MKGMTPSYNLLDEPWLPVRFVDGATRDIGLRELFDRLGEISALAETAPPALTAQYRLLLAITHRGLTCAIGSWTARDRVNWFREGLPQEALKTYLEHWRDHFWLFHPEQPFMQVAELARLDETAQKSKPWTQVSLESATGASPLLFDHSQDGQPLAVPPARALRSLLGFLQFIPGGLVKVLRPSDRAGPLANTAAAVPMGGTLAETLCLALHSPRVVDDFPAWERPPVRKEDILAEATLATGPNDRYTRLTRSVLLLPDPDGMIRRIRYAAGLGLLEDPAAPDPMASYRAGATGLVRLAFSEGRALWRELPALVPDQTGEEARPAEVLGLAADLVDRGEASTKLLSILVTGLTSDQAKLVRWRCEQINLPEALLMDPDLAAFVRKLVGDAEEFYGQVRRIATDMFADAMPGSSGKETRARARALVDASGLGAVFFAHAGNGLPLLLQLIIKGDGEAAVEHWNEVLVQAGKQAWEVALRSLGGTPIALRSQARSSGRFYALFRKKQQQVDASPARRATV